MFRTLTVPLTGRPSVRLSLTSGSISGRAEDRDDVFIDGKSPHIVGAEIDDDGVVSIAVSTGAGSIELVVPVGCDVVLGTRSGRVTLKGEFGAVQVTTESGAIGVERCGDADLRTGTGSITVEKCEGQVRALSQSGKVSVGGTESAELATLSSSIEVDSRGPVRAKTTSGSIHVRTSEACDVSAKSISGSIDVHLPRGVRPATFIRTNSGRQHVTCAPGDDCRVALATVSGTMRVDNG